MRCPHCNSVMEHIDHEPDVGVVGGYVCTNENCNHQVDDDFNDLEGDEVI